MWCGLTNRGWGSLGQQEQGLQRIEWRGETPFELVEVKAKAKGFVLHLTQDVDPASVRPESFVVRSWTYDHHEDYGGPPRDERAHPVAAVRAVDARTIELELDAVPLVRVYELRLPGLRRAGDGQEPWHGVAWYTRNRAPR